MHTGADKPLERLRNGHLGRKPDGRHTYTGAINNFETEMKGIVLAENTTEGIYGQCRQNRRTETEQQEIVHIFSRKPDGIGHQ